jgi:hypothetical protein
MLATCVIFISLYKALARDSRNVSVTPIASAIGFAHMFTMSITAETTGKVPAGPLSPARRLGVTKRRLGLSNLDGRSLEARLARQIVGELVAGFGPGITAIQMQACERAALLCVVAKDLASRRLAGHPISLDELLRTEAVAKRAVAAIKAEWPVRREGGSPSLADILSEEAADGQD